MSRARLDCYGAKWLHTIADWGRITYVVQPSHHRFLRKKRKVGRIGYVRFYVTHHIYSAAMSTPPRIAGLDHVVLTVASIPRTIAFYEQALGFKSVEFKPGRYALHFGRQKINLHEVGTVVDPNVRHATPGSADVCFLTATPLGDVIAHLSQVGVNIVQGPVNATGACARLRSVYFYDPDENLIEVANEADDGDANA